MNQRKGAYPPEFRQQLVELVRVGRKPSELAQEFGCHDISISAWVRQAKANEIGCGRLDAPLTNAERQELVQLRRQLRQITQERDILAKATAWFANKDSAIDKTFIS
jgi:transposase